MNRSGVILSAALFAGLLWAGNASAQNLNVSVVSGNGQLICNICFYQPMVVKVTNQSGAPQAGATVSWAVNIGPSGSSLGFSAGATTTTDANGLSTNTLQFTGFQTGTGSQFTQFTQATVTATAGNSTATFTESQALADQLNPGIPPVTYHTGDYMQLLLAGTVLSGQSGTTGTTPITVQVAGTHGTPIPNVSVQLVSLQNPASGPVVSCAGSSTAGPGVALTDANGIASCTPVFSGAAGTGNFYMLIGAGGIAPTDPNQPPSFVALAATSLMRVQVTAATVGSLSVVSGNSQTVNPGQNTSSLTVQIKDTSGNPLVGQTVNWTVSPANAASVANASTTTDANGQASNIVSVSGNATGTITVTATSASDSSKTASFTINVVPRVTITGFTIVSGNNQSASVNTAFGQPLVVQVTTSTGGGAAGVPVQFSASGPISLNATNVQTDSTGKAQVTVTAGSISGAASVTASVATGSGTGTQTFNLTVLPPAPLISASNFVNAADPTTNTLSPCSLGALVGSQSVIGVTGLAPTLPGFPVNTGVRITIGGVSAPILDIGTTASGQRQILFQVPCEVSPGTSVPATINLGAGTSNLNLNIQAASPGIYQAPMSDGVVRAILVRPDGSIVSLANPARRGETEVAFVTGLGTTSPQVGTGGVPPPNSAANVLGTVVAGMNGGGVPIVYARLSEDLPGVYVVAFQIPNDISVSNDDTFSVGVVPPGATAPINSNAVKVPVQ